MGLVTFRFPTDIRFGAGARAALADLAGAGGVKRPLLVTDQGMPSTEAFRLVAAQMDRVWPDSWTLESRVQENPREEDAEQAYAAYRDADCDGVIAVGGGSAIDAAKALVLKIGAPERPIDQIALAELAPRIVPLCAIPTTAGTGSEVGRSTVITLRSHGRKAVFGAPALLPQLALLDPELTVGLPPHLTAATGMDAMTHAIESFVCPLFHPLCDGLALEAIYRIKEHLPRAVSDGGDLTSRGEMLVAAAMGAIAFQKDLGAAHSLAHPLSSEFGAHHGLANAIVLPAVVRFNGEKNSGMFARVAQALGVDSGYDSADAVASFIEAFNDTIGITQRVRDLVPEEGLLPALAAKAFADPCHQTNPRSCTQDDLLRLYREAW